MWSNENPTDKNVNQLPFKKASIKIKLKGISDNFSEVENQFVIARFDLEFGQFQFLLSDYSIEL